jgi:hypothetical protein
MKKLKISVSFFVMFFLMNNILVKAHSRENNEMDLNRILTHTADYCEKVKKMALHYVCKEEIFIKKYFYREKEVLKRIPGASTTALTTKLEVKGSRKVSFIYDYQLIRKFGEMTEQRKLLVIDGKNKKKESNQLTNIRLKYFSKYVVYGPVGFLSKFWQNYFDYEIIGKDSIKGKKAIIIQAYPNTARQENYNIARIWINYIDYSIMRIEWEPLSIQDYEEEIVRFPTGEYKKTIIWNVIYGIEEKGVRFPNKQTIHEIFINEKNEKIIQEEIIFHYTDYKFFIVETDVRFKFIKL